MYTTNLFVTQIRKDRCRLGVSLFLPAGFKSIKILKTFLKHSFKFFFYILSNFLVRTQCKKNPKNQIFAHENMKKGPKKLLRIHNWIFLGSFFRAAHMAEN
jgi:hypothetical protein